MAIPALREGTEPGLQPVWPLPQIGTGAYILCLRRRLDTTNTELRSFPAPVDKRTARCRRACPDSISVVFLRSEHKENYCPANPRSAVLLSSTDADQTG